ncbi:MAG TPA: 3-deoxy-D-manno-octulosonate 8-phosphate phosphatase [Bacteroidota bacterium]|nr:3-deoxy-D-manno-octulosonate 8-phosphate phosphatase [Bacteroidota bacterium]
MVTRRRPPSVIPALSGRELKARAASVCLLLTDNDGVLTDTGVYYGPTGEVFKRFSIRDGMAVRLLRREGIETAIITGENSPSIRRRAEKLKMKFLYLGIDDKRLHLKNILSSTHLAPNQIAFIGDDVNDLGIIEAVRAEGLTGAPADAMPPVARAVHYLCATPGGRGAFREFADWLIALRGKDPRPPGAETRAQANSKNLQVRK